MAIQTVGAGQSFATIAQAVQASSSGDTIAVQAGLYRNDFITIRHDLILTAIGGPARLVATVAPPNGKAIITEGGPGVDVVISGFDISGARVRDGNGAAIRYEGGTLTLNGVTIHHAVANNNKPKNCLTPSIQAPARGMSFPAEAPIKSKGTPIPQAIANKAPPPKKTSPVWEI